MQDHAIQTHREVFGCEPEILVRAPGRVNLIGEHIDYLGGFVLPVAIEKHLWMAVSRRPVDNACQVWSESAGGKPASLGLHEYYQLEGNEAWLNYVWGVLAILSQQPGFPGIPGFAASITSEIPVGAGLSSSAALEVATALAVETLARYNLPLSDRALLCQRAEHEYANVPCGIMDQLAVTSCLPGHALYLDCQNLEHRLIPIPEGISIIVADTQVTHKLREGEYRKRREDCEKALRAIGKPSFRDVTIRDLEAAKPGLPGRLFSRAHHAVTEIARVQEFVTALQSTDTREISRILFESHRSLAREYEVSCPEMDHLVDAARAFGPERGCLGARMTGAGFGGSILALARQDAADELSCHLARSFQDKFGRTISPFVTRAVQGASYCFLGA